MVLDERILRRILTLAEEMHFGRAAAILHVSQPALSGTVKSLERDLGVRLFTRTSRKVELTDAGLIFVAEARRLVQESERAVALVRRSSRDALGPVRIGYAASIDPGWLGSLIAYLRAHALPGTPLEFISAEARDLHGELIKGTLHAAFLSGPSFDNNLPSIPLFREPFAAVLPSGHPLARSEPLHLHRLRGEPVVWLRRDLNRALHASFTGLCASHGYTPKIAQEVRTFYECVQFVQAGLGISFVPPAMNREWNRQHVAFRRLSEDAVYMEHTLVFRDAGAATAVEPFVSLVRNFVSIHQHA